MESPESGRSLNQNAKLKDLRVYLAENPAIFERFQSLFPFTEDTDLSVLDANIEDDEDDDDEQNNNGQVAGDAQKEEDDDVEADDVATFFAKSLSKADDVASGFKKQYEDTTRRLATLKQFVEQAKDTYMAEENHAPKEMTMATICEQW